MASILKQIVDHKLIEIEHSKSKTPIESMEAQVADAAPPVDFIGPLNETTGVSLIAEVKKASPSKGLIRADFDPVDIAKAYALAGASCVSVLTDQKFFQGHLDYLRSIREAIELPILRKDFIVDRYQVFEARAAGADAVLLIAECLEASELTDLHDEIEALGMLPLVEFYWDASLQKVLDTGAKLIGINNRNLETFETDLLHCVRLRQQIPAEKTVVGESGIFNSEDVAVLKNARIDAMLVGESLMRSDDISEAVQSLLIP